MRSLLCLAVEKGGRKNVCEGRLLASYLAKFALRRGFGCAPLVWREQEEGEDDDEHFVWCFTDFL